MHLLAGAPCFLVRLLVPCAVCEPIVLVVYAGCSQSDEMILFVIRALCGDFCVCGPGPGLSDLVQASRLATCSGVTVLVLGLCRVCARVSDEAARASAEF